MKSIDPTTMSSAERIAELGEILAAAIQRFLARESNTIRGGEVREEQLAVSANAERHCDSNSMEATK